jgi:hypothetical protein
MKIERPLHDCRGSVIEIRLYNELTEPRQSWSGLAELFHTFSQARFEPPVTAGSRPERKRGDV